VGASRWRTREMARAAGSQATVARAWRAFGLEPHLAETFQLSTDPYLIEKVHDVVGRRSSTRQRGHPLGRGEER